MSIDWLNKKDKISEYFTVGEATYLPKLGIYYNPTEEEKQNILKTALRLDKVRKLLDTPIIVTIWIRPTNANGTDYNALVGGAKASSHITGEAVDFICRKYSVDEVLDKIQPKCEEFEIALENNGSKERIAKNGGKGESRMWIHMQTRPLNSDKPFRIFNP